jgi:amino acid adenylation domain-containing protein
MAAGNKLKGIEVEEYPVKEHLTSKFDLTFNFSEVISGLELRVEYNSDLYDRKSVMRMIDHVEKLIEELTSYPSVSIKDIDYISGSERNLLLKEFQGLDSSYPSGSTLVDLFEAQSSEFADSPVVQYGQEILSYKILNERSNRLAHYLRSRYDIKGDDLVGIKQPRSVNMIISILGVLKAGGAYIPIDPDYPEERISYIMEDSKSKVLLDEAEFSKYELSAHDHSNRNPEKTITSKNLAYVIYTSGSTGHPKGCMLEHGGIINRIDWMWKAYDYSREDVILQKTTYTFDVSVWELFMPLCWGARMVLCSKEDVYSPDRILKLISEYKVNCLHFVPSMLTTFITWLDHHPGYEKELSSLRCIITSGEALSPQTVSDWYNKSDIVIHNLYGPTEASVDVTHYSTCPGDKQIPIGRPISNTSVYILDESSKLVPVGVTGELCISGICLSRGYLNKADLSSEKFVAHPFISGERMYKTGDLARWLSDGQIEYIGRKDDQVKIRGFRIELGEIENTLSSHESIRQAVVMVKQDRSGEKNLVAYVVSPEGMNSSELQAYLAHRLPSYMIPGYYVQLEELPLTASGKVSRKMLPEPEGLMMKTGTQYQAPRNEIEHKLVELWKQLLNRDTIGINDNFFEAGGNSLKIVKMVGLLNQAFHTNIPVMTAFRLPNINSLAEFIYSDKLLTKTGMDENIKDSVTVMDETMNLINQNTNE